MAPPTPADLRWALGFVRPHLRRLGLVLGLSALSTALSLALPLLSREFVDSAILGRDAGALVRISLLFLAVTAGGFLLNLASGLRYTRVSADILFEMRLAVYRHLQQLSPRYFARTRLGDIVARVNNDIGEIQRIAAEALLAWVGNALFLVGTLALMLWLDWRLFLVGLATVPLSLWALQRLRARLADRVAALRQRSADVGSFLIETLQGMKLVVASNAQAREVSRFRDHNRRFIDALMSMQVASYLTGGVPGLLLAAGTLAVFVYGGLRVISGAITLGTFVAFVAYQMRLTGPLQGLLGLYTSLATVRVSLGRVQEIIGVAPEVVEAEDAVRLPAARGDVAFEHVRLTLDRGVVVLDDVSFEAAGGERVAIVGPSGAGKSTIADLVRRLIDPDAGCVRLDGHDLRSLRLEDVRRHVALVDQEPFLFHASILENLRYARPDAADTDVRRAAEAAGLADFIARLPDGYDTLVGERGLALSVGERQRLAIARALLADPAVLVLDEATAALDPPTERLVIDGYESAAAGRTSLVITHRHHLALRADRVVVLDGARIAESGTPAELAARSGAFSRLFGVAN